MTTNWLTKHKYRITDDTFLYIDVNERCNHARATLVTADTQGQYASHCCMMQYVMNENGYAPSITVYNANETQLFYEYLENWTKQSLPYQVKFRYYNTETNEFACSSFVSIERKPPIWVVRKTEYEYKMIGIRYLVDSIKRRRVKL